MGPDRTIFDEPHYQSLELIAATALADGDPRAAFKFADRRCRILPVPEPHCYVLRGEASFRLELKRTESPTSARRLRLRLTTSPAIAGCSPGRAAIGK